MNRVVVGIAAIALAVTSACDGSGGSDEKVAPTKTVTSEVPRVSQRTFCTLVFQNPDSPVQDAADLVSKFADDPDPTRVAAEDLKDIKGRLESLALRSPADLAPHVLAEAETMQTLLDAHYDPSNAGTISFETFKSSGLEIATACGA